MIERDLIIDLLKKINICISRGDYCSAKELSNLELEKIMNKKLIYKNKHKKIELKKLEKFNKEQLIEIIQKYNIYIIEKVNKSKNINELKKSIMSIENFLE